MTPFRYAFLSLIFALPATVMAAPPEWTLGTAQADLRAASCTAGQTPVPFTSIPMSVQPIDIAGTGLTGATLSGAWILTSEDPSLGGLSGLSLMENGDLLSVSDVGRFFRIRMAGGKPTGEASKAAMRFENRLIRPSKLTADAEGLAYRDGLALVSFERNFRVLAFDIGQCGAAARGITIATPPKRFGNTRIRANAGPEALSLDAAGALTIGYEQPRAGRAVTARVLRNGSARLSDVDTDPILNPDFRLVGLDHLSLRNGGGRSVQLLRAYDRERGNRSILTFTTDAVAPLPSVILLPPLQIDNFEGVALSETQAGIRAYIISDDNFSDRQQTRLYALDISWPN